MKILFISLGSGYKEYSENFKFVQELQNLGHIVNTYSIDMNELPDNQKSNNIIRVKKHIQNISDIEDLFQEQEIILNEYDNIIICDSIDFKNKSEVSKWFENFFKKEKKDLTYFHYISWYSEHPTFNLSPLQLDNAIGLNKQDVLQIFNDSTLESMVVNKELFNKTIKHNENLMPQTLQGQLDMNDNFGAFSKIFGKNNKNAKNLIREIIALKIANNIGLDQLRIEHNLLEKLKTQNEANFFNNNLNIIVQQQPNMLLAEDESKVSNENKNLNNLNANSNFVDNNQYVALNKDINKNLHNRKKEIKNMEDMYDTLEEDIDKSQKILNETKNEIHKLIDKYIQNRSKSSLFHNANLTNIKLGIAATLKYDVNKAKNLEEIDNYILQAAEDEKIVDAKANNQFKRMINDISKCIAQNKQTFYSGFQFMVD